MNNVSMVGRISTDLELKTTKNGKEFINFSIAINRKNKTADGEKITDFFNVVAWQNNATFINTYFSKGDLIAIQGELQTQKYEDKNGNNRTHFEILAKEITFCNNQKKE